MSSITPGIRSDPQMRAQDEIENAVRRLFQFYGEYPDPDISHGDDQRERLREAFNTARMFLDHLAHREGFRVDFSDPEEIETPYAKTEYMDGVEGTLADCERPEYIGVSAFKAIEQQMRADEKDGDEYDTALFWADDSMERVKAASGLGGLN